METEKQLIIIPFYNEEATIEEVLREVRQYYTGDILLINDGSTDNSYAVVQNLGLPDILVQVHCENKGYGAALIQGFNYAIDNDYTDLITMDCDKQHEPRSISMLFSNLCGVDIVSGSRYIEEFDQDTKTPSDRYEINRVITEVINSITYYGLTDAFCGFKAYRVGALKKLKLDESGYAFPLQVWLQAYYNGFVVKEVPVARIYQNLNRTFGNDLDKPERRLQYYKDVIDQEVKRWQLM